MKMLQEYWASTVIFIGIFSQCTYGYLYSKSCPFIFFCEAKFLQNGKKIHADCTAQR